jgi:MFS family permease
MTTTPPTFRWRTVMVSALLPTVLFSIGEGAIIPIIPVVAHRLGADLALSGVIAAMLLVGELIGDIPSGAVVARIGERRTMIGAAGVAVLGLLLCVFAANAIMLGAGILLVGVATASFALARHAFMTSFVPPEYRARALSTLGGTFRFGYLVGPFLTAGLIEITGTVAYAFWIHLVACALTALVLIVLPDPAAQLRRAGTEPAPTTGSIEVGEEARGLFRTIAASRGILGTVGVGSAMVSALRASRQVVLPLWAVSIGLHETSTAVIIGIAGAVDFALFYLGGQIMDRFGRLWVVIPSMIGLGVGHLVLALSAALPGPVVWFVVIAMFLSLANGIGSGILMTIGADLADPRDPAPFLGAWRFCNDSGAALAPLIVSGVTALAGLPIAAAVLGLLGLGGAAVMRVSLPRHSSRA